MGRPTKTTAKPGKPRKPNDGERPGKKKKNSHSIGIRPPTSMTTHTQPPRTWPSNLPYLSVSHLDGSLTPAQHDLIRHATPPAKADYMVHAQCTFSPTSNPLISIVPIRHPSHPANGQYGLFAARPLAAGSHILDYTGLLHSCPLPTCSTSGYDLAFLDRDASLAIDGANMGNEARFINDYHGICDGPNAVFEEYYVKVKVKGKDVWEARMGVWVHPAAGGGGGGGGGIAKDEEICLSYGKGYWRARVGLMEQQEQVDDMEVGRIDACG